jgi:type III pantothenate kinase
MLLTIDVGNTQTAMGLFEGTELTHHWRLSTQRQRSADEYRLLFSGLLDVDGVPVEELRGASIASVVPAATAALRAVAKHMFQGTTVVVEPGTKTGIPILIDNPREVGADRIANSVAVGRKYGSPAIVVDFGTATNFDVVSAAGEYIGGVIAPGVEVSHDALVGAAAALRKVELAAPRSVIGKGTVEAIQAGLVFGHAALVDGICERLLAALDGPPAIVATGGLASTIVPHCRSVETIDEFLTLDGLRFIYELNTE